MSTKKTSEELAKKRKSPKSRKKENAKPLGRPTDYNDEIADYVCEQVATHDCGLDKIIANDPKMPSSKSVYRWRYKHPLFRQKYALAKMAQADILAEQCLSISDDARGDAKLTDSGEEVVNAEFVARSRLRVDTRKWLASKLMPKQYGDARQIEDLQAQNDNLRAELKELREALEKENKKDY